ncbi:class I SAM-dependent methyltransferase [Pararhizobium mangrovi]|uniref:Class I SAM-dependent methyltransferase n=1 Tax=Pararhizobium mangrovi TaxID=2590452 RepID=A0A506U7R8_9HYPH|nr:class I SAM-dependent methyltransferase [Pararhizobium mangrovi]TPW30393.1 class I SAM-dependent methyltransferase [Pararhizobium mangrovi]
MATPLLDRIKAQISASGPIGVADYFAMCLSDPQAGYYTTREPFGRDGDFVTAPEVSQLFGEIVGIFLVGAWQAAGEPSPVRLVELGPGRGTMTADILRVVEKLAPALATCLEVHLVETSSRLARQQRNTLAGRHERVSWHTRIDQVPAGFMLLVANEFFDAIPIRQFVRTESGYRERCVGVDAEGNLVFAAGAARLPDTELPASATSLPPGTVVETSPARAAIMEEIAARLASDGGVALAIDYGHLSPKAGDTLQALRAQRPDPPLAHPGEADLTSHVDFDALARTASAARAHVLGTATQGDFLVRLGLLERAGSLGHGKDDATQEAIRTAVERLAAPGEGNMGELFKVLAIGGTPLQLAPFRTAD